MQSKSRLWPFRGPLTSLILGFVLAGPAAAATFTVDNLSDSGPGSLRQAVLDANAAVGADFIIFQAGLTGTITLTSDEILITDSVEITGPGAGVLAVHGNDTSRIFRVQNALVGVNATVSGLTLTHGSERFGGAVAVFGESLTLRSVVVSDSEALFSGGNVYVQAGSLTVQDSTVSGGVTDDGGGIAVDEGLLVIDRSTVSDNQADNGGAIHTANTLAQIVSSTISGNSATSNGGGFFGEALSTFEVRHTTVSGNTAGSAGGSFYLQAQGILALDHAIVANGTPQDLVQVGSSISAVWSLIEAPAGAINGLNANNLLGVDARLAPLADNGGPTQTHALLPDSPALNAGNPLIASAPATDQRGPGFARIVGGRIDVGSFEEQAVESALAVPSLSEIGLVAMAALLAGIGVLVIRR
ncbi:MAG TPA: IPTL-CTERM sorting domain-containing protein [Thermoanaerobaculia bacterium]|nr:IPTL-CTERM sorting domain-containing protein [Thermoanaerobaculia bacterium]